MVTQRDGIIVKCSHDVHDVLSLRDGTYRLSLHIVAVRHEEHIRRIGNSIAQSSQLGIAVHGTVYVVLIEDDDASLFLTLTVCLACIPKHHIRQQ